MVDTGEKPKMRAVDVLNNIKNHKIWHISDYKMPESEAEVVKEALQLMIDHETREMKEIDVGK